MASRRKQNEEATTAGRTAASMAEIADFFDVDERQVRRWKRSGCPALQKHRGPYELEPLIAWHTENVHGANRARLDESEAEARKRKAVAEADRMEWDAKLKQRQFETLSEAYIPREAYDAAWSAFAASMSRQLELLPRAAALELEHVNRATAEKILQRHVDDVRALAQREDLDRELVAREKALDSVASPHKTKATRKKRKARQ